MKVLSIKLKTLKLPEKIIQKTFQDISLDNNFMNRTPIAQEIKARIDK
jgi:hypothetical protein